MQEHGVTYRQELQLRHFDEELICSDLCAAARLLDNSLHKTLFSPVSNAICVPSPSIEQIFPSVVLRTCVSDDYRGGDG